MIETHIAWISSDLLKLQELAGVYVGLSDDTEGRNGDEMSAESMKILRHTLDSLTTACQAGSFEIALQTIATTYRWLEAGVHTYSAAQGQTDHVIDAVWHELDRRKFFHLSPERVQYYNQDKMFGEVVYETFPLARYDITEAGNCLATDCNTAAVFHLMRAVEWGLRHLCVSFGLHKAKIVKKSGKKKYTPIPYVDWETMLNELHSLVDAKTEKMRRGPQKQRAQEYYYPLLQDVQGIRDAWRNHVMHTRAEYNAKDADAVLGHVRRILTTLAAPVRGGSTKVLAPLPTIHSAKWGIGGEDYRDVTAILKGFLESGTSVRASNALFTDPYPNKHKHLMVEFSMSGSNVKKTRTFREGERVRFRK